MIVNGVPDASSDNDVNMSMSESSQVGLDPWQLVAEARAAENAALQANVKLQEEKAAAMQQAIDALKSGQKGPASEESAAQNSASDTN